MWPVGFGGWGELPSAPRTVARAIATPLIQFDSEVWGDNRGWRSQQ